MHFGHNHRYLQLQPLGKRRATISKRCPSIPGSFISIPLIITSDQLQQSSLLQNLPQTAQADWKFFFFGLNWKRVHTFLTSAHFFCSKLPNTQ